MGIRIFISLFLFSLSAVATDQVANTLLNLDKLLSWLGEDEVVASDFCGNDYTDKQIIEGGWISHESFCDDLPIGGRMQVNMEPFQSESEMLMKYNLQRTANNIYEIGVNPVFWSYTGERLGVGPLSIELWGATNQAEFSERLENCLMDTSPIVAAGVQLNLRIDRDAPEIEIQYTNDPGRANVSHYRANSMCSTLIHEIFHYLGLPDEYFSETFQARRLSQDNLMSSSSDSFSMQFGYFVLHRCSETMVGNSGEVVFNCNSTDSFSEIHVPIYNFDYKLGDLVRRDTVDGVYFFTEISDNPNYKVIDMKLNNSGGTEILREDQVNVILYPNCSEKNQTFYDCAELAYDSMANAEDKPKKCN